MNLNQLLPEVKVYDQFGNPFPKDGLWWSCDSPEVGIENSILTAPDGVYDIYANIDGVKSNKMQLTVGHTKIDWIKEITIINVIFNGNGNSRTATINLAITVILSDGSEKTINQTVNNINLTNNTTNITINVGCGNITIPLIFNVTGNNNNNMVINNVNFGDFTWNNNNCNCGTDIIPPQPPVEPPVNPPYPPQPPVTGTGNTYRIDAQTKQGQITEKIVTAKNYGTMILNVTNLNGASALEVRVYDVNGNEVAAEAFGENGGRSINNLPAGEYIVKAMLTKANGNTKYSLEIITP